MASKSEFEILEGDSFPTVRQVSVFLDNRVGQLLVLTQALESKNVRILALSVTDSDDCAVVRLVCDLCDDGIDALRQAGFSYSVRELVVVQLPPARRALLTVWSALLSGEINIKYAYPLLTLTSIGPAIALSVDNLEGAIDALRRKKFVVLSEADLQRSI